MKAKLLYIFILLFSLTVLPNCKSSPEDTGKNSENNTTADGQPKNENPGASKVDLEAPKMSDVPALLQLDPPVPLLPDILPAIPNNLNDSVITTIRLLYKCEDEKEKEGVNPMLHFRFNELYSPDITWNWGNTLCRINKTHVEDSSPDKYVESETEKYHCRKELSKIISESQKTGYKCYVSDLYVGLKNRQKSIKIF